MFKVVLSTWNVFLSARSSTSVYLKWCRPLNFDYPVRVKALSTIRTKWNVVDVRAADSEGRSAYMRATRSLHHLHTCMIVLNDSPARSKSPARPGRKNVALRVLPALVPLFQRVEVSPVINLSASVGVLSALAPNRLRSGRTL